MKIKDGMELSMPDRLDVVKTLRDGTSKQEANFRMLQRGLDMAAGAEAAGVSDSAMKRLTSII